METDYEVPRVVERFQGTGHSLSAPSAPQIAQLPGAFVQSAQIQRSAPISTMNPDLPSTTLQIRLADGTRLVCAFNNTQLVSDVAQFVRLSRSESVSSMLVSGFPPKVLDLSQTLEEAGVLGAVIIEKRV
jgi:UBX domain-containing protein 1